MQNGWQGWDLNGSGRLVKISRLILELGCVVLLKVSGKGWSIGNLRRILIVGWHIAMAIGIWNLWVIHW